jgi:hypothetical protein
MITFDEQSHTYYVDGKPREGVSHFIERHKVPFPKEMIAEKTAQRDGTTAEEVLKDWDLQGKMARELGSACHTAIEYWVATGKEPKNDFLKMVARKYASIHDRTKVKREVVVYNDTLAGTIDELEIIGEKRCILRDTKTNGDLYKKGKKMLPPYEHLTDSPIDTYTLQLNLYRELLEYHGWTVEKMELQHLTIGIENNEIAFNLELINIPIWKKEKNL